MMATTEQRPLERRADAPASLHPRRFQAVRPVDVEARVRERAHRFHALMAPLLAVAGALCGWLIAAGTADGVALPGGATPGTWALGTAVLFLGFAASYWLGRGGAPVSPGRATLIRVLMLLAAACLGMGAALLAVPGTLDRAAAAGVGLCGLAMACMAGRPLRFAVFALLVLGPLVVAAGRASPPEAVLAVLMAAALVAMVAGQALLSSAMVSALRSEARHRATLSRLEVANEALFADRELLHTESRTDPLTGVANRRYLEEMLQSEWNRCRRSGAPLSCVLLDIDQFKAFNDHYGHDGGDACLRQVAEVLKDSTRRAGDVVARYGGEEFIVLLPETAGDGAATVADLLKRAVADSNIPHAASQVSDRVTISLGVASLVPDSERLAWELFKAADLALYEAKRAGRDCIVMAGQETLESARMAARGLIG